MGRGLTNAEFTNGRLRLDQLAVSAPAYRFQLSGNLTPQQTYPMDIAVQWSMDGGEFGRLRGQAKLSGDLQRLTLYHRLTAPVRAELRGTISDVLTRLSWQGELTAPEINLQTLHAQWPALTLGGTLRGKGDLQRIQAQGELHSRYQDLRADHRFAMVYDDGTLAINRFETTLPQSGAHIELHGTLTGLARQPQAAIEGTWQGLRWPLQGASQIRSAAGRFSATGTLDHYQMQVDGDLAGEQLPPGNWSLNAEGTPQHLTVNELAGRLLGGTLKANGRLDWQPQLHWQTELHGEGLDPGVQWPEWPGRIAFTAHSSGAVSDGAAQLQVVLSQLQGELKSAPIDGEGILNIQGDRFDLAKLRIDSGGNHFTAAGSVQDTWNMQWRVTAADLKHLMPGSAGHFQGSGDISGPRNAPTLTASLAGQQLNIADKHIGEIALVMAVDMEDRVPSTLELEAHNATFGDLSVESLRLRGDGTAARRHGCCPFGYQ